MKSKIPPVQQVWRKYNDELPEKLSILNGWKIISDIQETLYNFVIPHLIAIHWYSSFSRPRKYRGTRKHRNL